MAKASTAHVRRNTIGGVIGNVLEWYDFAVFGFFAPIIGAQFFPATDPLAALINAFGVFAAGYLMRPLGGILFGHIGDRLGRKKALLISVLMMGLGTTVLGILPTYARVGLLAPILLILVRLIQGVSVGGEYIGSISFVAESAPEGKKGFYTSWTSFSATGGIMIGSALAAFIHRLMPAATLSAWGWRLPFLAGLLIGGFGLWMRRGLQESPDYEKAVTEGRIAKRSPLAEVLRTMPLHVLQVCAMVMLLAGGFYTLFVWWPTYLAKIVVPAIPHALTVNTIAMAVLMCTIPLAGWLSDRAGIKRLLTAGTVAMLAAIYPLFVLTDYGIFGFALLAQILFAVLMGSFNGVLPVAMVGVFPTQTRFTGIGIGYNVAMAAFGGTAPLICTWLIQRTGNIAAPAFYLIALGLVSLLAIAMLKNDRTR